MPGRPTIKKYPENRHEWAVDAACRGRDTNLFFQPDGERRLEKERREARAKAICYGCNVLHLCLQYALDANEAYGIWGGLNEGERDVMRRQGR